MFAGSSNTGAMSWYFQRISGLLLAVLLLFHFALIHGTEVDPELHQVTYKPVAERLASSAWKTMDLAFLVLALFHGLNGIWMVLGDYVHRAWARNTLFTLVCILGFILLILGSVTILSFRPVT
jgi:succinate dehydrogenase / fumarate reductase membrane anchor subunit